MLQFQVSRCYQSHVWRPLLRFLLYQFLVKHSRAHLRSRCHPSLYYEVCTHTLTLSHNTGLFLVSTNAFSSQTAQSVSQKTQVELLKAPSPNRLPTPRKKVTPIKSKESIIIDLTLDDDSPVPSSVPPCSRLQGSLTPIPQPIHLDITSEDEMDELEDMLMSSNMFDEPPGLNIPDESTFDELPELIVFS